MQNIINKHPSSDDSLYLLPLIAPLRAMSMHNIATCRRRLTATYT